MVDFYSKPRYGFDDLVELVRVLRAPDGCPWDSVQTHGSIRRNFIEEVYEACEAIDRDDPKLLQEELGDVLLHVVFHAGIEADRGRFTIDDVCDGAVKKQVSRHPALFGGETGLSWDEIKRREKGQTSLSEELDAVARSLPALWRAEKLQSKAAKAGIAAPSALNPELEAAVRSSADPEEALGSLLFSVVALARSLGIDPEDALNKRCDTFLAGVRQAEHGQSITNRPETAEYEGVMKHEQN